MFTLSLLHSSKNSSFAALTLFPLINYPAQIFHFTFRSTSTSPQPIPSSPSWLTVSVKYTYNICLCVLRLTNVLLAEPKPFKLKCVCPPHFFFFKVSGLNNRLFFFYWPVSTRTFSLLLCLDGGHPGVIFSLLTVRLGFCRYRIYKAAGWGGVNYLFLVHRALPLLSLFWLKQVYTVLWNKLYSLLHGVQSFFFL